jgi:hypothetical protein
MIEILRRRPRKSRVFRPILSTHYRCEPNEYCNDCLAGFQAQVDRERPNHVWRVEDGKVVYKEDDVYEEFLGRKLKPTESVIHKNGLFHDCRLENLELINIERLDG